jgi:hypothetical protein
MNSLGRTPKITRSALLPSVCQNHVVTGVLLVLGTNTTSNLNPYAPTTAETTREPTVQRGAVRPGMGAVRPPPPGNQEILRNTSSEHQNAPRFHQQRSLVKAMLATRKSWRKPKLHPGCNNPGFRRGKPESLYLYDSPGISGYRVQISSQKVNHNRTSHHTNIST